MDDHLDPLMKRMPELTDQCENILRALEIFKTTFDRGGRVYVCGNGGSAADAEHIVGEMLKGFLRKRPAPDAFRAELKRRFGGEGVEMGARLQCGLPMISLVGHSSFLTAFANDVGWEYTFAQHLYALGESGDALWAISTSGNSLNVTRCLQVASAMRINSVVMTGSDGGRCADLADCVIRAPAVETYQTQEYHVSIYHAVCARLEEIFYGEAS